jgi:hypothetical protein
VGTNWASGLSSLCSHILALSTSPGALPLRWSHFRTGQPPSLLPSGPPRATPTHRAQPNGAPSQRLGIRLLPGCWVPASPPPTGTPSSPRLAKSSPRCSEIGGCSTPTMFSGVYSLIRNWGAEESEDGDACTSPRPTPEGYSHPPSTSCQLQFQQASQTTPPAPAGPGCFTLSHAPRTSRAWECFNPSHAPKPPTQNSSPRIGHFSQPVFLPQAPPTAAAQVA